MSEHVLKQLQAVVRAFDLGEVITNFSNGRGFVNKTYEVETTKGQFIVQQLAPIFDERVTVDGLFLYGWLSARGFVMPKPVISPAGLLSVKIGHLHWRVTEYIEHDNEVEKNFATLQSASMMMGRFHRLMADCPYEPCFSLSGFHDTEKIVCRMHELIKQNKITGELADLGRSIYHHTRDFLIEPEAETQLIHGDPKFDNFLFVGSRAVALVDFDTVMKGSVLLDLGDAMRSWCRKSDSFEFDERLFVELVEAYRAEYRPIFSRDQIRSAVALITLELASRYLTDAYEQSYFNWDREKYSSSQEHNTVRARDYFNYYQSIVGE